jgi:hypothetical protein
MSTTLEQINDIDFRLAELYAEKQRLKAKRKKLISEYKESKFLQWYLNSEEPVLEGWEDPSGFEQWMSDNDIKFKTRVISAGEGHGYVYTILNRK